MRPFESDTTEYRKARALEAFNATGPVMHEYKRLNPQAISACPHVALCVGPRQMVEHGDPGRRGTDHSESYGASIKDSIHRRCLRRKKGSHATVHHQRDKDGKVIKTWIQKPLGVSRIMQTFRDQAVREKLMREDESEPYWLRKHFNLRRTGFATVGEAAGAQETNASTRLMEVDAIYTKVMNRFEEGRSLA